MGKMLFFIWIILLGLSLGISLSEEQNKIAMIVAKQDFRDEELLVPKQMFENAGSKVVVFSDSLGKARGMLGAEVSVDNTINKLNTADYKAIIFVGGVGASRYWNNKTAHNIARDALANNKVLGAICIAPVILANAGVLEGKRATVWPLEKSKVTDCGAKYTGASVEVSGNIITADGPNAAEEFAKEILKLIQ